MKKILRSVVIILASAFVLTGCGSEEKIGISNEYVEISNYKNLEISEIVAVKVTEEDVEAEIEARIAAHDIKAEVKNRGIVKDDTVVFDCAALIQNVAYKNLTVDDQTLRIGENTFVEGFDDMLLNRTEGEEFEFDMNLPDPYIQDESLSGVEVHWIVTIEKIYEGDKPELTDDFVKNHLMIPGVNTAQQYRNYIKQKLEKTAEMDARYATEQEAWEALYANTVLKALPEGEVESYVEKTTQAYEQYAQNEGLTFDEYMERMGITAGEFKEEMTEAARNVVIQRVIFTAIAQAEGLEVDDEEYEKNLDTFAFENGYDNSQALTALYTPFEIKDAMMQSKVLKFIVDNSTEDSMLEGLLSLRTLVIILGAVCILLLIVFIIMIVRKRSKPSAKKPALDENGYNPKLEVPDPEEEKSIGDTQIIESSADYEVNSYDPAIESDPMVGQNK